MPQAWKPAHRHRASRICCYISGLIQRTDSPHKSRPVPLEDGRREPALVEYEGVLDPVGQDLRPDDDGEDTEVLSIVGQVADDAEAYGRK